jgi:hypothetical protein
MLNPFFLQGSKTEQGLIQDLINEQLRMYGVEVYYLPRKFITEKTIIKEVIESKFDNAYPIEAYVDTYEGYEGQGTILSKFGIQPLTDLTLIISKERFEEYISPLIKGQSNIKLSTRPKEGDLIYFPLGDRLFEIKFIEHEKPFYQLQKTYVYELKCELFRYEDEVVDTGIEYIDDNIENDGYIQTLTMVGAGITATAVTGIVNGGVRYITITNRGSGYTSTPRVAISSAPFEGISATGIATMIGNLIDCNGTTALKVQGVELTNPGSGYTVAPSVAFFGGGGTGAMATAEIGDGIVGIVTLTNGGSGYATPPSITFTPAPSGGITAIGAASINDAGVVTSITIRNAGLGYTQTPTTTISSPYMIGVGTYITNETVTGSTSGATALVKTWNVATGILEVYKITKDFVNDDIIVGAASSASYKLRFANTNNIKDPFAQNNIIQQEANQILDFSEKNPFGTP